MNEFFRMVDVDLIIPEEMRQWYATGVPAPATPGSGAVDLFAAEDVFLAAGQCLPVKTGLRMHMRTPGIAAVVLPRSGLGAKNGLVLGNLVGFIDNDYQGEIICYMWNRNPFVGGERITIQRGMKFAQMAFIPYLVPNFRVVEKFEENTIRGTGGFGSTDVRSYCAPAYGDCNCECHRNPGIMHFMACCTPAMGPERKIGHGG